jgi:hypothetical protein
MSVVIFVLGPEHRRTTTIDFRKKIKKLFQGEEPNEFVTQSQLHISVITLSEKTRWKSCVPVQQPERHRSSHVSNSLFTSARPAPATTDDVCDRGPQHQLPLVGGAPASGLPTHPGTNQTGSHVTDHTSTLVLLLLFRSLPFSCYLQTTSFPNLFSTSCHRDRSIGKTTSSSVLPEYHNALPFTYAFPLHTALEATPPSR